jgi:regulatory protein
MIDPGIITSVEPDSRGAGALRVQINGRSFCTIPSASAQALGLRPGLPVDGALREQLNRAADAQAAFRFILAALGRRGFARRDLERRLVHRGHPGEAARAAVERAAAAGLLDDREFAGAYAQVKAGRGRGPARLLRDLLAMGVDRAVAEEAIAAAWAGDNQEIEACQALAVKRAAQLGPIARPAKRRRLLAYLARRGFTGSPVRTIVNRVLIAEDQARVPRPETLVGSDAMR